MNDTLRRAAAGLVLLGGVVSLVAFGVVGLGRAPGTFNMDGMVLFSAGRAWLAGIDPYDHAALSRAVADLPGIDLTTLRFFYLPQSAPLFTFLGLFTYPAARIVWLCCNLLAIAATVALALADLRRRGPADPHGPWIVAGLAIGNPFVTHVVWMGQTTLIAFAAAYAAWTFTYQKPRPLLAGFFLGLASFKPQVCILVGLWFLLERRWKTLLAAGASVVLLAAYPLLTRGPLVTVLDWRRGVSQDYGLIFNQPGSPHKVGLESLLHAAGLSSLPGALFLLGGIAATAALWWYRERLDRNDWLALVMAATFTFSRHLHDYDLLALLPLFVALWSYVRTRPRAWAVLVPLVLLLFVPQRLLRSLDIPLLNHWRTLVIVALGVLLLRLSAARAAEAPRSYSDV